MFNQPNMENITITISKEQIEQAVAKAVDAALKSDYSNPVREAVTAALKDQEGVIRKAVDGILAEAILDPKFKESLGANVLARMVEMAMKK